MNKQTTVPYLKTLAAAAAITLALAACHSRPDTTPQPAAIDLEPTHIDSITVYSDEAFRYLMEQEVTAYESHQPGQHIRMVYLPEQEVLRRLTTDSFSNVVIGRRLSAKEKEDIFSKNRLMTDERAFAKDAVAIVVGEGFAHDTLTYDQLSKLVSGRSTDYKLVFEGNGSGVLSYMFAQLSKGGKSAAFAAKSTEEVIDYVQKDNKTIGFISFAKISDDDDSASRELLKKVKVLSVAKPDSTGRVIVSTASQSEIADGSYPFARPIVFILHSMEERVGTGFANYLYKDPSGRIVLKSGLVPTYMPPRTINVNTEGIK